MSLSTLDVPEIDPFPEDKPPIVADPVLGIPHGVYNAAIVERDNAIAERDKQIVELRATVAERDKQNKARKADKRAETFPSAIAALAILAALRLADRFADENDNEAQRQSNGSVRLSIKQKSGGHMRVFVRVPEVVDLIVVDDPNAE